MEASKNYWERFQELTKGLYQLILSIGITYPEHLIPKSCDIIIDQPEGDHYLCVRVEPEVKLIDDFGRLDVGAIDVKRIPGFSTNKIPKSEKEDLCYQFFDKFKNLYKDEWKPGMDGKKPKWYHIRKKNRLQFYYIPIKDIHEFQDTYINENGTPAKVKFTVQVVHKPLISNYWHFELRTTNELDGPVKYTNLWKKAICSSVRNKIIDIAILNR